MKHLTQHNKKSIEALLVKILKKMFAKVDLHFDEWDVNSVSFEKVRKSPKIKRLKELSKEYDGLFKVAEALGVRNKLNPHFVWFKDIFKETHK